MSKRAKTAIFLILLAALCAAVYLFTLSLPKGIDDDSELNIKRVVEGMFTELTDAEYENMKEAGLTASENFASQSEIPQWATVSHNYLKDPVEISGSARTDKNGKITSLAIRGCEDVKYPMGLSSQLRLD